MNEGKELIGIHLFWAIEWNTENPFLGGVRKSRAHLCDDCEEEENHCHQWENY